MSKIQGKINKTHKLTHLEQAWNSNVAYNHDSKRLSQMSNDIKSFITRSMSNEQDPFQKHNLTAKKVEASGGDLFSTISSAFGFTHHEGTDSNAELKVIKVVLVREGFLMSLRYLTDKARKNYSVDKSCASILELLAQIRESTLNYLEALCLWRQTAQETETPRMFYWERKNYTIKIVTDLDFLADNAVIVNTLGIPESQFRANPLMLTNNLEDMNTWMDPQERAVFDSNGRHEGPQFESRLRLRFAERILLQEVELVSAETVNESQGDDSQQIFLTQQQGSDQQSSHGPAYQHYNQQQHYQDQHYQQQHYDDQYQQQLYQQQQYQQQQYHHQQQYDQSYSDQQLMKGSSVLEEEDEDGYEDERFASPPGTEGLNSLSNQKSTWGNAAIMEDLPRARSADSASSMAHPQQGGGDNVPNSRSSTISFGFSSAPSSSQASRGAAVRLSGNPVASVPTASSFEFGHDFFSGNWGDGSKRSTADTDIYSGGMGQQPETYSQQDGNGSEVYYADNGTTSTGHPYPSDTPQQQQQQGGLPPPHHYHQGNDAVSVQSVDTVSGSDIALLAQIQTPPKELVLAGSACIILLSSGSKVPLDLSWGAFLRLMQVVDVSTAIRSLESAKITKFKLVALLPFLQLLTSDPNLERVRLNNMLYPQYIACSRFVAWVKQFTASALTKLPKQQQLSAGSPNKKLLVSTSGHRLPAPSKVVLHPIQVDKRAAAAAATDKLSSTKSAAGTSNSNGPPSSFKKNGPPVSRAAAAATAQRKGVASQESQISPTGGVLRNNKAIPKVALELVPCHNEVVEGRYKNALLLVLMSSPSTATMVKKSAGLTSVLLAPDERLVAKVIDIAESREASLTLNMREYSLFADEMRVKHGLAATKAFAPQDLSWWVRTIGQLIVVVASSKGGVGGGGSLKLSISRRVIEDLIVQQATNHVDTTVQLKVVNDLKTELELRTQLENTTSSPLTSDVSPRNKASFSGGGLREKSVEVQEVRSARGASDREMSAKSVVLSASPKEVVPVIIAAVPVPVEVQAIEASPRLSEPINSDSLESDISTPQTQDLVNDSNFIMDQISVVPVLAVDLQVSSQPVETAPSAVEVEVEVANDVAPEQEEMADVSVNEYETDFDVDTTAKDVSVENLNRADSSTSSIVVVEREQANELQQDESSPQQQQQQFGEEGEGTYGEEAFEEERPAVVLKEEQGQQISTSEEAEYAVDDFEAGSVLEAAGPEESTYGADFEEPSQMAVDPQEEDEVHVRHALSESVAGMVLREAERDLQMHPDLIHNHREMQPVVVEEEEDSYLLDEYEEDSLAKVSSDKGRDAQQTPSIIEQVQQEFDDFEELDTELADDA